MKMYLIESPMPARRRRQRNPEPNPPFGLEWSQLSIGAVVIGLAAFALYMSSKSKQVVTPPVISPIPLAPAAKGYFAAEGIWYVLVDWKSRLGHTPAPIEWIRAIHLNTKLSETVAGKVYDRLLEFWRVYNGNDPSAEEFATIVREVGAQNGWAESTGAA